MNKGGRGWDVYLPFAPMRPGWGQGEQIEIRITREKLPKVVHATLEKNIPEGGKLNN
jgi:hypothetical protein